MNNEYLRLVVHCQNERQNRKKTAYKDKDKEHKHQRDFGFHEADYGDKD